ncbi:MAG: hypothetical protein A3K22_02190 [Deltaproteobacteria bacterium RBG_16_42_7]|nr:MAG: hypothetical protein A3K22_02170 [Deltaproteobacteria bacterium RBG_16_42_7]OGP65008.1 MAG: hypothetical protein A3K22_02190 [Deltaproteobacteria bacterium RBG_16_42_7]
MITLEESAELAILHGFCGYGEQNGFYTIPVSTFHNKLNKLCNQVRDFAMDDAEELCETRACCINEGCSPEVAIRQVGKDILGMKVP